MKIAVFKYDNGQRLAIGHAGYNGMLFDSVAASELVGLEQFKQPADVLSLIESSSEPDGYYSRLKQAIILNEGILSGAPLDIKDLKLQTPIARPGKIICLAGNYRDHIVESGYLAPQASAIITPQLFLKPSTALIGNGDEIL